MSDDHSRIDKKNTPSDSDPITSRVGMTGKEEVGGRMI